MLSGLTRAAEIQSYTVTEDEHIRPSEGVLYYRGVDCRELADYRTLPTNFFRDIIMKAPPRDLMNTMQRGILTLACYDDKPDDISLENVPRQCLQLLSSVPVLAIYAYQAWRYAQGESLFIHVPQQSLSTAENFLLMLRESRRPYLPMEERGV